MDAAENRHHHRIAGVLPIEIIRVDALDHEREQTSAEADESCRQNEGDQLEALGVEAETANALFVVADGLQNTTEWRMGNAPDRIHAAQHHCDDEVVIG